MKVYVVHFNYGPGADDAIYAKGNDSKPYPTKEEANQVLAYAIKERKDREEKGEFIDDNMTPISGYVKELDADIIYTIKCCKYEKSKIVEKVLFKNNSLAHLLTEYKRFIDSHITEITAVLKHILDEIGYYCFNDNTILTKEIIFI